MLHKVFMILYSFYKQICVPLVQILKEIGLGLFLNIILLINKGGHAVAQLVEALRYKP